ncbi:hypothetical protein ACFCXS_32830 [Streptomyces sp. NPDC056373]|uniref:hypothetical protein n=1 Tax=Streptomyces sp. NPDC056373 TaxID=3345798 RepID=UPI0035E02D38
MHAAPAAAALPASAAATTASAATAPVSRPRVTAHFDLAAAQQPENITLGADGSTYLTFSFARQIVRVGPSGRTQVLATLPAPPPASTPASLDHPCQKHTRPPPSRRSRPPSGQSAPVACRSSCSWAR